MDLYTRNALLELTRELIQEKFNNPLANALFSELYLSIANEDEAVSTFLENVKNAFEYQNTLCQIRKKLRMRIKLTDFEQKFANEHQYEL